MKTGIWYYSKTGHTKAAVKRVKKYLEADGHEAVLHDLAASVPSGEWDALCVATPVYGFSLPDEAEASLQKCAALKDIPTLLLTTQFFPFSWMGGNQTLSAMEKHLCAAGARIAGTRALCRTGFGSYLRRLEAGTVSAAKILAREGGRS
ncbi:MAG: flavodoxin family protein [Fibrobacterota bacterium]